jgi:carboxymethylenebutenolidase
VTALRHYLAEEIATDHLDGLLTRREAIRRLGLLGMAGSAAAAPEAPPQPAQPPGMANAQPTSTITWRGPQGDLQGAWVQAANSQGAVLVIHENKELNDGVRSVAGRLAGAGYSARPSTCCLRKAAPLRSLTRRRPPRRWAPLRQNSSPMT